MCRVRSIHCRTLKGCFKSRKIKAGKTGLQHIVYFRGKKMHSSAGRVWKGKRKKLGTMSVLPTIAFFAINLWVSVFLSLPPLFSFLFSLFSFFFFFLEAWVHIIRWDSWLLSFWNKVPSPHGFGEKDWKCEPWRVKTITKSIEGILFLKPYGSCAHCMISFGCIGSGGLSYISKRAEYLLLFVSG